MDGIAKITKESNDEGMAGVPVTRRGTWMQLPQSRIFYPMDPHADDVVIDDIALSLSRQIRYNGLSDSPINVAHHSCNTAWLARMEGQSIAVQLAMLMHDAPEYIIGDLIRPVKVYIPTFSEIEEVIDGKIKERFNLPVIEHELQKHYDNMAWAWEKRDIFPSARNWPYTANLPDWLPKLKVWSAEYSRARFLNDFTQLRYELTH